MVLECHLVGPHFVTAYFGLCMHVKKSCTRSSSFSDSTTDKLAENSFAQYTGFSSEIGTKLRESAVGQAGGSCYSRAALSSNDSKTLYIQSQCSGWTEFFMCMNLGYELYSVFESFEDNAAQE